MTVRILGSGLLVATALAASAATARPIDVETAIYGGGSVDLTPYLQCVPYARQVSGVQIYGDAWTWWNQAAGKYERGFAPRVGAVMSFKPHGSMRLGHVAAVSRIVDSRTVLIRHSNWSPINGRRGQIEDNVRVVDVSPDNDWSEVRVWYGPIQALGRTHWPLNGFIYNRTPRRLDQGVQLARKERRRDRTPAPRIEVQPVIELARSADPIGEIIAARSVRSLAYRD